MDSRRSLHLVKSIWALQWYHFRFLESVRNVRTLCKQTQKSAKECFFEIGMKFTPGKVDMGCSMVPFSSSRKCEKCKNLIKTNNKIYAYALLKTHYRFYQDPVSPHCTPLVMRGTCSPWTAHLPKILRNSL